MSHLLGAALHDDDDAVDATTGLLVHVGVDDFAVAGFEPVDPTDRDVLFQRREHLLDLLVELRGPRRRPRRRRAPRSRRPARRTPRTWRRSRSHSASRPWPRRCRRAPRRRRPRRPRGRRAWRPRPCPARAATASPHVAVSFEAFLASRIPTPSLAQRCTSFAVMAVLLYSPRIYRCALASRRGSSRPSR